MKESDKIIKEFAATCDEMVKNLENLRDSLENRKHDYPEWLKEKLK